jgi:hypothetical protein
LAPQLLALTFPWTNGHLSSRTCLMLLTKNSSQRIRFLQLLRKRA